MLESLLTEIRNGGTLQPVTLAARLNLQLGLVEAMLEDLERRGLLTQVDVDCNSSCGGCSLAGACGPGRSKARVWQLK